MQIITYIIYIRSVTREQLYEMFWPEYELQKPSNYLSVSLNHIKSLIEVSTSKNIDNYFNITREMISLKHEEYVDIKELKIAYNY
jgi:DNA-binding SARP family transcriptional activator